MAATEAAAKPGSPGRVMILMGGVGGILWLVGAIMSVINHNIVAGVGGIILGIGALFASFAGIGFWQRTKDMTAILTFIFALVGGVLFLVGGIVRAINNTWGPTIFGVGQVLFAVSLLSLGLILNKLESQLNTKSKLGMDIVYPAMLVTMAGGCVALGGFITGTLPAAVLLMILFFVTK